jgi:cytochrome c biogenesis protein CcmG/thiol:disulfide interchange protein DsbE
METMTEVTPSSPTTASPVAAGAERAPARGTNGQRPRWGAIVVWVSVLGLLSLLGIGVIRSQQGPINVGARIPDFTLTTFDGQTFNTADLRGQVIVINFWASWCDPCKEEAAALEQANQEYRERGVVFLGVNYVDTEPEALAYLDEFGITYPNGPDLGTEVSQAFRMRGVPETYVVDGQGILVSRKIGPYGSLSEIEAALEAALRGAP